METGKDIADEIRRDYAKSYWSETSLTRDGKIPKVKAIDSGELADRIENACKSEPNSKPANNAACRAALDDILEKIDEWRNEGLMEHWQYLQLFEIADNAIAEPARNCDKYDTEPEARKAFLAEKCKDPCGDCSVQSNEDALCHQCGIKWLFSKEG